MTYSQELLRENILHVKEFLASCGNDVTVVAATKTIPAETVNKLKDFGIAIAGENRVQEFLTKYPSVEGVSWHFIGQLQSNKVRQIIDKVDLIHSLDRISLASEIDRQAEKIGKVQDVLVEINMGQESSKGGVLHGDVFGFVDEIDKSFKNVKIVGIMSVLPIGAPQKMYLQMRAIYDKLKCNGHSLKYLSMGMSGDYKIAVECGSNMIRLGSCIFGQRK